MSEYDVIIVGGGAAGLICGGFLANAGKSVLVAEKRERPGRKILMTGKGRCNLTNNCTPQQLIENTKTNPKFLYSSFNNFTSQDTMNLFEKLGVPLKTERGNRVYPKSERAMDIADAMVRFLNAGKGRVEEIEVKALLFDDSKLCGITATNGDKYYGKSVVVATGGMSYPTTGSTGDGYKLARQVGHTVKPLRPSLVGVYTQEDWVEQAMGVSLKNVELKLYDNKKKKPIYQELGEMLFTHEGISGPLVLSASAYMNKDCSNYSIEIDFKPALSFEELDNRVQRDFQKYNNKDFSNSLGDLLPMTLIPVFIRLSGIEADTKVNQITREERHVLVGLLKGLKLTPKILAPIEQAVITSGGVNVKEIDPKTMESKIVENLYFAGEVIDVDAFTGGFNLQIAFSTGHQAAMGILAKENH